MCGLAGYSGVAVANRIALAYNLGLGIDKRGGHASGYVSLPTASSGVAPRIAKRIGTFGEANTRFTWAAGQGEVLMMHARFATCGERDNVKHAHPFVIRRGGKAVMYGAHNGVLTGTFGSALKNGRNHTVDSREMLELLADGDYDGIRKLSGYGVVTWVTPDSGVVNMVRLSDNSDIVVCHVKTGGIVWASTWPILKKALKASGLKSDRLVAVEQVGLVYSLSPDGATKTTLDNVKVDDDWKAFDWKDYANSSRTPLIQSRSRAWNYGGTYTEEDAHWDLAQEARDRAKRLENGYTYRSDGKLLKAADVGVPTTPLTDALALVGAGVTEHDWKVANEATVTDKYGRLRPSLPPKRRPLSEMSLDDLSADEIDSLTDDEWDAIVAQYQESGSDTRDIEVESEEPVPDTKKVRVG